MKSSISRKVVMHSCKGCRTPNGCEINNYSNYTGCTSLILYTTQTSLILLPIINKSLVIRDVWSVRILFSDLNYLGISLEEERFYGMPK